MKDCMTHFDQMLLSLMQILIMTSDSENDIIFGAEESEFPKTDKRGEHEIEDKQSVCEKLKEL